MEESYAPFDSESNGVSNNADHMKKEADGDDYDEDVDRAANNEPIRHISGDVYKISVDLINLRSPEALCFFLLWSLDSILDDLRSKFTMAKCKHYNAARSSQLTHAKYSQRTVKDAIKAVQLTSKSSATERFALIYPILREVVLGGSPGSEAIQQIFSFAIEAEGEDNPELSKEAVSIVIWCFSRSTKCYEQWEKVYQYNIVGSVAILKKISDDLEVQATKLSPYFRQKNKKALATETNAAHHAHFKDADKYCKIIAGRVSQGLGCKACLTFAVLAAAVGAVVLYPNLESLDFKNLSELINSQF